MDCAANPAIKKNHSTAHLRHQPIGHIEKQAFLYNTLPNSVQIKWINIKLRLKIIT